MLDGCFDPLHLGHIRYFQFAAKSGLPVFCNVENDTYIKKNKKRPSLLPQMQRVEIIDSIKYISFTHLQTTTTADVLATLRPIKYIKGADWSSKNLPKKERETCKKFSIEIVHLHENLDSSTNIVDNFIRNLNRMK